MLLTNFAWAQERCESTGVEFGFFNGVQTPSDDAQRVVQRYLPELYGRTIPDGQPINYTLYYNDNQAGITDFIETFEQRLQEQDGLLAGRFELYFSAMNGGGSWWSRITETVPALRGLLEGLADTFRSYLIRGMTADFGNPNMGEVSQRHREQIDHAVAMDKGLLLFAHSQGNLFVNQARDHALTRVGPDSVRVVHVAPASPRWTGPHSLADLDIVINLLRTVGTVLPITDSIPGFLTRAAQPDLSDQLDPWGHGLLETYLNRNFEPSTRIRRHVEQALEELARSRPTVPNYTHEIRPQPPEELPWQGGPQPAPVYTITPPSHRLDQVRYRGDFTCGRIAGYVTCRLASNDPWSVELTGMNINGRASYRFRKRWPTDISPWDWTSSYVDFPSYFYHPMGRLGFFPEEVQGLENWPAESAIRLSTLTYRSHPSERQGSSNGLLSRLLYNPCHWSSRNCVRPEGITFVNAVYDYGRAPPRQTAYSEPYRAGSSVLANQSELDAWRRGFEQHQSENGLRWLDYVDRLRAYEQRQRQLRTCVVTVRPDPTPEEPPPSGSTDTPDLPECTAEQFANNDTSSCRVPI